MSRFGGLVAVATAHPGAFSWQQRLTLFLMAEDPNAIQTDELKARVGQLRRYL
jgi:hypothetical protein